MSPWKYLSPTRYDRSFWNVFFSACKHGEAKLFLSRTDLHDDENKLHSFKRPISLVGHICSRPILELACTRWGKSFDYFRRYNWFAVLSYILTFCEQRSFDASGGNLLVGPGFLCYFIPNWLYLCSDCTASIELNCDGMSNVRQEHSDIWALAHAKAQVHSSPPSSSSRRRWQLKPPTSSAVNFETSPRVSRLPTVAVLNTRTWIDANYCQASTS